MNKAEVQRKIRILKRMQREAGNKHPETQILANVYDGEGQAEYVGETFLSFVRNLADGAYYKCRSCGGLLPLLSIAVEGHTFTFACVEIADKEGNILAKTDEVQLEKQLHVTNKLQSKKLKKES